MLERISEWLKKLPKCSRLDSPTELSEICSMIPLNSKNCFPPGQCKKMTKEKTELYLTWYAKDSFFECYHKKGSALLDKPWKSVIISPHEFDSILFLIFVDMCTLQHKIFNLSDEKSWRNSCLIMFEKEYRPAKLFTRYKLPFNSRDFEFFAQSCGYVMCGWNSHKFLQKQIQYFKESYELIRKIKYILTHSSTVSYDLTLLQYFVGRNLPQEEDDQSSLSDQSKPEEDSEEENLEIEAGELVGTLNINEDRYETASNQNTRTDGGTIINIRLAQPFDSETGSSRPNRRRKQHNQQRNENTSKNYSIIPDSEEPTKTVQFPSSMIGSMSHFISENRKLKNAFMKSNFKNETNTTQIWESVLVDVTIKDDMYYFIFMDADSCYPQVMESECCDDASCIDSCNRFLERHPETRELHATEGMPFDSDELKNYLEMKGVEYYSNSPLVQYLKQPKEAFSVVKRIISRNYSNEKRSRVLSEFVKKKIIMRNIFGTRSRSMVGVSTWRGKTVLAVEMENGDGNYVVFIDLEMGLVEAYPKKPKGRFIFPQEIIVAFVEAFNDLGIPKELHTIGSLFDSPEFDRLIQYCHVRHCRDCWHVERGLCYFHALDKVKCCFERASDVERGLLLWESLRKRLEISRRMTLKRIRKSCLNRSKKNSKGCGKNTHLKKHKHSRSTTDYHMLTYAVERGLGKANDKKHKEKKRENLFKKKGIWKKNNLSDLSKKYKSKNLKSHVKTEKHSEGIEDAGYQEMLNTIFK